VKDDKNIFLLLVIGKKLKLKTINDILKHALIYAENKWGWYSIIEVNLFYLIIFYSQSFWEYIIVTKY